MSTPERVRTLVEPLVAELDLDLYDLEHTGGVLRVLVDQPGGVDIDAIAALTRAISRALDEHDPIPGEYTLEVSSPGLERRCARRPTSPAPSAPRVGQDQPRHRGRPPPRRHPRGRRRRRRRPSPSTSPRARPAPWPTTTSSGPAPSSSGARHPSRKGQRPGPEGETRSQPKTRAKTRANAPSAKTSACSLPAQRREGPGTMSNLDMMEALQALAADKGISVDTLLGALADALESAYKRMPGRLRVRLGHDRPRHRSRSASSPRSSTRTASPSATSSTSRRDDFGRIAAQTAKQVMTPAHPRGRARAEVRGVRRPRGRHRHRHHPAERQPLHAARPRPGRGAAAPGRAGALRAPRAEHAPEGLHRRGPQDGQGPPDRRVPHPSRASSSGCSSSRCPRSPTASSRSRPAPASPGTARRSPCWSNDTNVDPVGACVGARGARVRMVVNELRGEKIDIVPFSDDPPTS